MSLLVLFVLAQTPGPALVIGSSGTPAAVAVPADRAQAIATIEALSLRGGPGAFEAIADFVGHWKGDVEMEAHGKAALARMPVDAQTLVKALADPDPNRRALAAFTAGEQQIDVTYALRKDLRDDDPSVRSAAALALGVLGDDGSSDALMHMLVHDPDPSARAAAEKAQALVSTPRKAAPDVDGPIAKLGSVDPAERLAAVKALDAIGSRRAVGPLLALLDREKNLDVRKAAISALVSTRDEIVVDRLVEIARRDEPSVRIWAIGGLATLGDARAVEPLTVLAKDPDVNVRGYAMRALGFLNRPACVPALVAGLDDAVPEVRQEAAKGLAIVGDPSTTPAIVERIARETDPELKQFLCSTLGRIGRVGDKSAEKTLLGVLDDPDEGVREAAAGALGRIGTSAAEKPLLDLARREEKRKDPDKNPQIIATAQAAAKQVHGR